MVGQETTFVAAHAKVVDEESACCSGILRGVERRTKGLEQRVDFSVEFADFTYYGADELGLVGWQLRKCLGSLCMLHLELNVSLLKWKRTRRQCTNLLPTSPYIVVMRLGNLSDPAVQEGDATDSRHDGRLRQPLPESLARRSFFSSSPLTNILCFTVTIKETRKARLVDVTLIDAMSYANTNFIMLGQLSNSPPISNQELHPCKTVGSRFYHSRNC